AIGDPKSPPRIVVGTGNGGGPEVLVYNAQNNALLFDFFAYEESFRGGVNVAQGDVTGDGIPDIIAGTGVGGGPVVKVFDGDTGALVRSFLAYEVTFRGGVNVSTGDINGDGFADVFVGSGNGGGPVVKVFDGKTGAQLRSFLAYEDRFRGGVIVNAGDVNGDGFADIIAGTGVGGGPVVKVFNGVSGELMQSFFAYPDTLRGGVNVAGGDVNGDGFADIIVGAGVGGAPNVRVFDGLTGALVTSFFVFDPTIQGGVNVAATDVNSDGRADLIAGSGVGMPPQLSVYDAVDFSLTNSITPFDPSFTGGVFVG
ncbi:MAG: VCBS repeat-containing protein, partial [Gemmataceae bacterium]|nr:VCBS repeat-containing protein [Gemmataceae bacterium]